MSLFARLSVEPNILLFKEVELDKLIQYIDNPVLYAIYWKPP